MRVLRTASASRTTIASLAALYLTIVILTILLAERLILQPGALREPYTIVFLLIGLLFPGVLLVALGVSIARLVRDRYAGRPGSGLKVRLAALFTLGVVLASVPQGIVSIVTLSSALETVLASGTGAALRGGLDLALRYYEEQVDMLETIAQEERVQTLAGEARYEDLYSQVVRMVPRAVALSVYDGEGILVWNRGELRTPLQTAPSVVIGGPVRVSRASSPEGGFLRLLAPIAVENGFPAFFVVDVVLPPDFENVAGELSDSVSVFAQLERFRPNLPVIVAALYVVFAAPMFLMAILAGFFFSNRVMRPIESLEAATKQIAEGDYSVRILVRARDDLGVLVQSFNRMVTELDRTRRRAAQAEKVQAWQEIAQRLAHEVKNPLTPIRLAAERLRRRYEAGDENFGEVLHRTVSTIVREVDLLSAMLNEFRSFTRLPEPQIKTVILLPVLRAVADVFVSRPGVTVDYSTVGPERSIEADEGQLRQVLLNLFTNAMESGGERVTITCLVDLVKRGDATYARIRIEDDGPGIPPEIADSIFDPYVTSKAHGTGLGLAIVERIVFDHGGRIEVEGAPGGGASFVIDLPSSDEIGKDESA